jgi:hypothetical protein
LVVVIAGLSPGADKRGRHLVGVLSTGHNGPALPHRDASRGCQSALLWRGVPTLDFLMKHLRTQEAEDAEFIASSGHLDGGR